MINAKIMMELACIIVTTIGLYIYTLQGREKSNSVTNIDPLFMKKTEELSKDLEHKFHSNSLSSQDKLKTTIQDIIRNNKYLYKISILTSQGDIVVYRDAYDTIYTQHFYDDENTKKIKYKQWYNKRLSEPVWSTPYYTNESSDRSFVMHYTSNILGLLDGNVDAIVNFTCRSKLRKRSDI